MISLSPPRLLHDSRYVCHSCARRLRSLKSASQRRSITQNHIKKTLEARVQWAHQATEIKAGRKESMLTILEKRGYINQIIGQDVIPCPTLEEQCVLTYYQRTR